MKKSKKYLILFACIVSSFTFLKAQTYDMRADLSPSRLTIAMWDYSWLNQHYEGGFFEDYNKVCDELIERGFNTVRIDAFPLVIGKLDSNEQEVTIEGDPLRNWGASDKDRKHTVVTELIEFMKVTKEKNISVILSSWGLGAIEFPDIRKDYENPEEHWEAWEKVLDILKENDLLSHVVYVDFDQEFPFFSPVAPELNRLGQIKTTDATSALEEMEAAGNVESNFNKLSWNTAQMKFVRNYLNSTLTHFQHKYPELRFTFSLTGYWEEVRTMNIKSFDVLELHFWLTQSERFMTRSGFGEMKKDRGKHDYKDYMERLEKTMLSLRPMLMKDMHNRLEWAKEWSEEIGAPLTTTEAWGPWWHMDHKDLTWEWLYDWCEEGMQLASEYNLWGTTPWNYSHPYWENWTNVEWYNKVNNGFLIKPIPDYAQLPTNNDPYKQIRFKTIKGAEERRYELIRFIWNDGLPTSILPDVIRDVTNEAQDNHLNLVNAKLVKSIDRLELEVLGLTSLAYSIYPVKRLDIPRLVLIHAGHGPLEGTYLKKNYRSTIEFFLERGYNVIMLHMPMCGWNDDNTVVLPDGKKVAINLDDDIRHNKIIKLADLDTTLEAGAGFRPFLEPAIACINYWNHIYDVNPDVTMIGLSGGGWTTHMMAAIDTRIKLSFPVAGSYPLYLRNGSENKAHLGDLEQYYEPLYNEDIASDGTGGGIATWLEIYALGGSGKDRKQIMITSRYDECCFFGDPKKTVDTFKSVVKDKVEELGVGSWEHELDTTHREHIISSWMLDNVVKPNLLITN